MGLISQTSGLVGDPRIVMKHIVRYYELVEPALFLSPDYSLVSLILNLLKTDKADVPKIARYALAN